MHYTPPSSVEPGNWLVVIERLEASVFRSLAAGAAPQLIRSAFSRSDTRADSPAKTQEEDQPSFFDPLAGVLHGAQRILIFGRSPHPDDAVVAFTAWLRRSHPEIARRIVSSVHSEPRGSSDDGLLAKARTVYSLVTVAAATRATLLSVVGHE